MDLIDFIAGLSGPGARRISGASALDRASEHICRLLMDAQLLYDADSHATAAFLAITAIEEAVKAHLSIYMPGTPARRRRSKDPLYHHGKKHTLAALPTVAMSDRLTAAIGRDRVAAVMKDARDGRLVRAREASLYFETTSGDVTVPSDAVRHEQARELILFAVEVFDDAIVGYTKHSCVLRERTDAIFSAITG